MSKLNGVAVGVLGVALGMLGAIALPASVEAQSEDVDPLEDFRTNDNSSNPFEGETSQSDIFQMIHQMQLRNGGTVEEFNRQRQQNIQTEADRFRQQRLLQLENQPASAEEDGSATEL